ncbi:MAG TPA: cyclase dehydrase, partial [Acetobacteraceae bacterium]
MNDIQLARFLGCFSIGLGAIEVIAPRSLIDLLGLPRSTALVRAFGAREIAAGVAVLTYPDSPAPLWARVGGDALDLAALEPALHGKPRQRAAAAAATVAVLAITALDVLCAMALTQRRSRA